MPILDINDSVLDEPVEIFEKDLLGQTMVKIRVEITLCHPKTKPFQKMSHAEQKDMYDNFMHSMLKDMPCDSEWYCECFQDGNLHCHGWLEFLIPPWANPAGLACDVTQMWLNVLPKRYNHPLHGNVWDNYNASTQRICLPQCCVQIRFEDKKRAEYWEQYIKKNI